MEAMIGLILVVVTIGFLIFFKGMIKKTAQYSEDVVTVNIAESQGELIQRSMTAYEKLIEEVGIDYKTPQEVYNMMMRKTTKKVEEQGN